MACPFNPESFWARVYKSKNNECWVWQGHTVGRGYGRMSRMGRLVLAHRISWELTHGPIQDGLYVLHRCDNPPCVNPDHLFLGTCLDNIRDRQEKGRHRNGVSWGEHNGIAKLTAVQVLEMRRLRDEARVPYKSLAAQFGLSASRVREICRRRAWRHLP